MELLEYRYLIEDFGGIVTSSWLLGDDQSHQFSDSLTDNVRFAHENWEELRSADYLIAFTEEPGVHPNTGGRHVEFGMALAYEKPIFLVGPYENVFSVLVAKQFDSWNRRLQTFLREIAPHHIQCDMYPPPDGGMGLP